ncbi:restriction endonuclease subunit S [Clostridium perfringens]
MNFNESKLGDLCEIRAGGTPSRSNSEYWNNGDIPWIKIGDINNKYVKSASEYITLDGLNNSSAKLFKKGTILYTIFATVGEVAILDFDATTNQAIVGLNHNEKIDTNYLYYFLKSQKDKISNIGRGVAQNNINMSILRDIKVPIPDKNVQLKISEVLDNAQVLIDKRKKQIEELELLVKSKFIEMFGSENSIFEKWETVNIGAVSEVGVGVVIKPADYYTDKENGIKTFRSLNVGEMKVKDENWVYFSKEGNEKNKKSILKKGQILIVRSGYPGTACVVTEEYEGCNAIDVIIATPNNKKINSVYMCAFTNYRHGKNQILEGQAGAAQKHFNVGAYKNMKIALPPLEEQEKFELFLKQVDKLKFEMEKSLKELEDNFNSLMQKAFKGELFN